VMLLGGIWILQQLNRGDMQPLFIAAPTPTRTTDSFAMEGDANFTAGNLDAAIRAYRNAVEVDPNNAQTWAKLSRIQTYSSAFLITNEEKKARLLESGNKAVGLAPDDSTAHAIRAFANDWNANSGFRTTEEVDDYLRAAEQDALRALQLDGANTLALAFYAEILLDQQKWDQAQLNIEQALGQDSTLMDVHRVHAAVLETFGQYNLAITAWDRAIVLEPNFTFLYLRAGANYRRLAIEIPNPESARPVYEKSLEYFEKAARINEQIGVQDPQPYLSISSTYSQLGDFFAAGLNVKKALSYQPTNADIYGRLGIVYFRSRNYETSIFSLQCATYGCSGEDSCKGRGLERCFPDLGENPVDVGGLAISPNTIVYYYTYGSVLSALSRPRDNKCGEAMKVLGDVRTELRTNPDDYADAQETIIIIVRAGESICQSLAEDGTSIAPVSTEAGGAMVDVTATPTP
jgi:tetratricopeptide (TPR) repeat protein